MAGNNARLRALDRMEMLLGRKMMAQLFKDEDGGGDMVLEAVVLEEVPAGLEEGHEKRVEKIEKIEDEGVAALAKSKKRKNRLNRGRLS